MSYVIVQNGNPTRYSTQQLRKDNPNVSFPKELSNELLRKYNVYPLKAEAIPNYDPETQRVDNGDIVESNDEYIQKWVVVDFTQEESDQMLEQKRQAMIVTPRQARLALLQAGYLASIDTAIAELSDLLRDQVAIEWEYAVQIERISPWVVAMTESLGMTPEQVDQLFEAAAQL